MAASLACPNAFGQNKASESSAEQPQGQRD